MDFYIPGVPLEKIRIVGLRLQRGGVGFYPTSGSPFVHLDTGTIRHWPRMTHDQLAKVFPDGRTVHVPSDGQPLPGYALALADVERRGAIPSGTSLEAAREAGVITASIEKPKRNLLARIFGTAKDEDERSEEPAPQSRETRARAPPRVASLTPPTHVAVERIVPLPAARPKAVAAAKPKPAEPKLVMASASLPSSLFDNRGYWRGAVETATNCRRRPPRRRLRRPASIRPPPAAPPRSRSLMPRNPRRRPRHAFARWVPPCRGCRRPPR